MKTMRTSTLISQVLALALGPAGLVLAAPPALTKDAYKAAIERIELQAKAQRKACGRLKGPPREVCEAQAGGAEKVAKARLQAQYQPGPDAEKRAKLTRADADYDLAKVRCAASRGKAKDACLDRARHDREAAIRLAKVEKVEEMNQLKAKAGEQKESAGKPAKTPPKS